ncbi:MAG: LCP family protein [Micrococcales bacterium]|nr:LCP family protein [Micrococcales bacterium]MCL2667064.1 LCP family protein [Micrococcales bacterium]
MALALAALDALALTRRVSRTAIPQTFSQVPGQTWVIVGSDSRADLPDGPDVYGTEADVPGARADVILVVRVAPDGTSVLSLPRDLLVEPTPGATPNRLAALAGQGPDVLVGVLCQDLGIPTTHYVEVSMAGFVAIVDALGGIDVDIPYPVHDTDASLDLPEAGTLHLDGTTALALVRSRHPVRTIDGTQVATTTDDGARARTESAARVFSAVTTQAKTVRNPFVVHRTAWASTGALTVDNNTSLTDLRTLTQLSSVQVVPVPATYPPDPAFIAHADPTTFATLADHGYTRGTCHMRR